MKSLFTILLSVLCLSSNGQTAGDSLLINERSIDRPITLHKGFFRIEGGYALSTITRRFNSSSERIRLRQEGLSYVRHQFLLDFRYGISEHITFMASTNYKSQAIRKEQIVTLSATEGIIEVSEVEDSGGLDNTLLALSGRAPFTSRKLDIVATVGLSVPLNKNQEQKPEHTVTFVEQGYTQINYIYHQKWANNVASLWLSGAIKYRWKNLAAAALLTYDRPLGEGEGTRWAFQRLNNEFQYLAQPYRRQFPERLIFTIDLEQQLTPWFDLSILLGCENTRQGWDEVFGSVYPSNNYTLLTFNPGYEILVTPKIWLRQRAAFSLHGKDSEAPFSLYSSLIYNFF
jgi:hypothetical protein